MMGNFAWAERELVRFATPGTSVVEIGAGEGNLIRRLAKSLPHTDLTGLDLVPRPRDLPQAVAWGQGDLFQTLSGDVAVGVMIVHHFSEERLRELGGLLKKFRAVCFCEPWRHPLARVWGRCLLPFVGSVTRHDMMVSIDAGFVMGELPRLLGISEWHLKETIDWRGAYRLVAWQ
ncbi:hypothetical protein BH09VER1_BH09VER1_16770 [soil metagenome]